ncbi:hypothetical protein BBP40_000506 [Aspergillus hancockii]|nr:hypothetical protein BBP40_000506 [Aspergillus hancockii]
MTSNEGNASQAIQHYLIQSGPWSLQSGFSNLMQSLDILIDDVSRPFPASSNYATARWFSFLPAIYGKSRTLDVTIKCFAAHHVGMMTGNKQAVWYARSTYVEALNRLQRSLYNATESLSSEILCTVLLQCLYELFANTYDTTSWMKQAKGLSQLVEARGCGRYQTEFDHTLLKASRGLIVMHSVFSGEKCFLASGDWHSVMRQQFDFTLHVELYALVEDLFGFYTAIPSLIHQFFDIKTTNFDESTKQSKVSKLLTHALHMQDRLASWYDQLIHVVPPPTETLSSMGDSLYPIVYSFSDVDTATIFSAYYSYMALIHAALGISQYPGEHGAIVAYFRDQICKSVEYNARGLLGPYRLGFPLRVAYEFADPTTKLWIEGWLRRLSRTYAAMLPRNYR